MKALPLASALALASLLTACSAPKPAQPLAPPRPSAPVSPAPGGPVVAPAPPAKPPEAPARAFDESLLRGREFLLERDPTALPPARDPVVGVLARDPSLVGAVQALLQRAATGELEPASLVPRWAESLQSWARRARADGLSAGTVHVGEPLTDSSGGLMVPVRVFGGTREFTGWVLVVRAATGWLASDAQLVPADPVAGPLDPESPGQLISSPMRR